MKVVHTASSVMKQEGVSADALDALSKEFCKCFINICVDGRERAALLDAAKMNQSSSEKGPTPDDGTNESEMFEEMLSVEEKASHQLQSDPTEYTINEFVRELLFRGVPNSSVAFTQATTRFHSRAGSRGTYISVDRDEVNSLIAHAVESHKHPPLEDTAEAVRIDIANLLVNLKTYAVDNSLSTGQNGSVSESNLASEQDLHEAIADHRNNDIQDICAELGNNKTKVTPPAGSNKASSSSSSSSSDRGKEVGIDVFRKAMAVYTTDSVTIEEFVLEFLQRSGGINQTVALDAAVALFVHVCSRIEERNEANGDCNSYHGDYGEDDNDDVEDEELDEVHDIPFKAPDNGQQVAVSSEQTALSVQELDVEYVFVEAEQSTESHEHPHGGEEVNSSSASVGQLLGKRKTRSQSSAEEEVVMTSKKSSQDSPPRQRLEHTSSARVSPEPARYNMRTSAAVALSPHEVNHFVEVTLKLRQMAYGEQILKFNTRATKVNPGHCYEWSDSLTKAKSKWVPTSVVTSPTGGWFHILNSLSSSSLSVENTPRNWNDMVSLNIRLDKRLLEKGCDVNPHAVVAVKADGTCLCTSILTALYLMPWFRKTLLNRHTVHIDNTPPISPMLLKRWVMFHIAVHSHTPLRNDLTQNYLSTYRNHHEDKTYRLVHPHSVFSLQQECDDIMHQSTKAGCSSRVKLVARALVTVANAAKCKSEEELGEACRIVDMHVQSFKQHRRLVYNDFLHECKQSNAKSRSAEELQLRAVWDVLGVDGDVYDHKLNHWFEFTGVDSASFEPLKVTLMKTEDHYYATVNLEHVRGDYTVSAKESAMCNAVKNVWTYPTFECVCLWNHEVTDMVTDIAVRQWAISDRNADIYKYKHIPMPPELEDVVGSDDEDQSGAAAEVGQGGVAEDGEEDDGLPGYAMFL
eukprot:gene22683-28829_t